VEHKHAKRGETPLNYDIGMAGILSIFSLSLCHQRLPFLNGKTPVNAIQDMPSIIPECEEIPILV